MTMGWLKKRLRDPGRSWWYVGYSYITPSGRYSCSGMIFTLATQEFVLPAVAKELEKIHQTPVVTVLSWQPLNPKEGEMLAEYFNAKQALADAARAEVEEPQKPRLTLVKLEAEEEPQVAEKDK